MRFQKKEEEDFSLQLTPLIDVVFLLLIFFMVSTTFLDFTKQHDIKLPEDNSGSVIDKLKKYEIEITKEGSIYLNGKPATLDSLPSMLAKKDETIARQVVVIRADQKLHYGQVMKIMGICKEAGLTDIGLAVQ